MVDKEQRLHTLRRHADRLERRIAQLAAQSNRWSGARLVSFGLLVILSSTALFTVGAWLFWLSAIVLGAIFGTTIASHRRLEQSIDRHTARRAYTLAQIARMTLDWPHIPPASEISPRYEHPFEADIDLVGPHALHRLMDVSVTQAGSRLLRVWLATVEPATNDITRRQQLVGELAPRALWRGQFHLNGTLAARAARKTKLGTQSATNTISKLDGSRIVEWFGETESVAPLRGWSIGLGILAALNIVLVTLNWLDLTSALWQYSLALYGALTFYAIGYIGGAMQGKDVFRAAADLRGIMGGLVAVFGHLETYSYRDTPHLRELCHPFLDAQARPSRYVQRVSTIVNATGVRGNPLIWFTLNAVVPWDMFFAWQLAECKNAVAQHIAQWLDVWYEVEVLSALANLHYLNPHYTLPKIIEPESIENGASKAETLFTARGLGHPLLPDVETDQPKVRNDFTVDKLGAVAVITGSNMAGKSTFLRALGMNLALAYAGGPVDVAELQTVRFRLFTSIKVSDSVTDGISYFYAEVRRLKALLNQLEMRDELPLFFCIDEIFRGTNNRERLIGSQSYIQALSGQNGIGLISTHDLELVKLADENSLITNYHFRDDVTGTEMIFDYLLRPGPCPTTNALKIMKIAGLPINAARDTA